MLEAFVWPGGRGRGGRGGVKYNYFGTLWQNSRKRNFLSKSRKKEEKSRTTTKPVTCLNNPTHKKSTFKEKNLLHVEQILSFKS